MQIPFLPNVSPYASRFFEGVPVDISQLIFRSLKARMGQGLSPGDLSNDGPLKIALFAAPVIKNKILEFYSCTFPSTHCS